MFVCIFDYILSCPIATFVHATFDMLQSLQVGAITIVQFSFILYVFINMSSIALDMSVFQHISMIFQGVLLQFMQFMTVASFICLCVYVFMCINTKCVYTDQTTIEQKWDWIDVVVCFKNLSYYTSYCIVYCYRKKWTDVIF